MQFIFIFSWFLILKAALFPASNMLQENEFAAASSAPQGIFKKSTTVTSTPLSVTTTTTTTTTTAAAAAKNELHVPTGVSVDGSGDASSNDGGLSPNSMGVQEPANKRARLSSDS